MSPQLIEGVKRGILDGFAAAGVAFFAMLATNSDDLRKAGIAAGAAFFGAIAARLAEAQFDANRDKRGDTIAADVTSNTAVGKAAAVEAVRT